MTSGDRTSQRGVRLSYAWVILAVSFITAFRVVSLRVGFGLYFQPIQSDLGWTRTTLSSAVAITMLVYGIAQPTVGYFADRFGPKWVILASVALVGLGMALLSVTTTVWQLWLAYGIIVGAGIGGAAFVTQSALISRWFVRRRALALGIGLSGASAGQFFILPATMYLIMASGWRTTALVLSLAILLPIIPLNLLLIRNEPRTKERADAAARLRHEEMSIPAPVVLRSQPFWMLTGSFTVCGVSITMLSVHLPGHVADVGLPPEMAAFSLSLIGALSTTSSILVGALAHDPPAGEDPLVHLLLAHVLAAIPGWLFLVAVPGLILAAVGLYALVRQRRLITFHDEPS